MAIFNSYVKLPEGIYVGNPSKLQDLELLQNLEPQKLVAFSVASELPKHPEKCLDLKFPSLGRPCRLSLFTLDSAIGSPIWSSFMVVLVRQRYPTNLYRITLHISICAYIYIHTLCIYIYVFIYVYIYYVYQRWCCYGKMNAGESLTDHRVATKPAGGIWHSLYHIENKLCKYSNSWFSIVFCMFTRGYTIIMGIL